MDVAPSVSHDGTQRIADFVLAPAELESRGVQFTREPIDSGVCLQAFFEAPDGNALALHHRYAPPAK